MIWIPHYKNKYVENSLNSTLNDMQTSHIKPNNKNNLTYILKTVHTVFFKRENKH